MYRWRPGVGGVAPVATPGSFVFPCIITPHKQMFWRFTCFFLVLFFTGNPFLSFFFFFSINCLLGFRFALYTVPFFFPSFLRERGDGRYGVELWELSLSVPYTPDLSLKCLTPCLCVCVFLYTRKWWWPPLFRLCGTPSSPYGVHPGNVSSNH